MAQIKRRYRLCERAVHAYRSDASQSNFYTTRLQPLFFSGLNNPQAGDLSKNNPVLYSFIGDVEFLNGGLFEKGSLDGREGVIVPDGVIEPILNELFDRFNFTVTESTPYDTEVAVDPEMLGKVFEELVNERHESGAYYTPRPVVSFMCREALKGYIASRHPELDADSIAAFVDEGRGDVLPRSIKASVATSLDEVTTVDPACGSGAYLLGMLQELISLRDALFNESGEADPRDEYQRKLHIISRNLYGADIDNFAVNIAMLRLWLSLVIEYEGDKPDPLPNLDFKIACGDSLLAPDPSPQNYGDLFGDFIRQFDLGSLKSEHMRTTEQVDKDRLKAEIEDARQQIRAMLGDAAGKDAIDWRVEFAEVLGDGGFDIVVANPPYVQLQRDGGRLANLYKNASYQTYTRTGDIYQLFYERGCQMLKPSAGLMAYITSNSWLKAEYGRRTRRYLSEKHTPLQLIELGKDVFESAIVDTCILLTRTGITDDASATISAVDMDRTGGEFPPSPEVWGQARPDGDEPWSILSNAEQGIMDKMLTKGTPLKEWDVTINRGVVTGYNKAFLIDTATKDTLVAAEPKSAEIIKPVLRGRDIQRYQAEWVGLWLIYSHSNTVENDYPAIREHLLSHKERLSKRRGGANQRTSEVPYEWWQLQADYYNSGAYGGFGKDKLFWIDLAEQGRFSFDTGEFFGVNTVYMMSGRSMKYLCAILNATLTTWFMRNTALTSGMGVTRWFRPYVEAIPIPQIAAAEQRPFIALVDEIIAVKANSPQADTSELEEEINWLVYDLYGLTDEETAIIVDAFWKGEVSEEEEDAALVRAIEKGLRSKRVDIEEAKSILRERHEVRN